MKIRPFIFSLLFISMYSAEPAKETSKLQEYLIGILIGVGTSFIGFFTKGIIPEYVICLTSTKNEINFYVQKLNQLRDEITNLIVAMEMAVYVYCLHILFILTTQKSVKLNLIGFSTTVISLREQVIVILSLATLVQDQNIRKRTFLTLKTGEALVHIQRLI